MTEDEINAIIASAQWRIDFVNKELAADPNKLCGEALMHGLHRHLTGEAKAGTAPPNKDSKVDGFTFPAELKAIAQSLRGDALFPAMEERDPYVFHIYDDDHTSVEAIEELLRLLLLNAAEEQFDRIVDRIEAAGRASFCISEDNLDSWLELTHHLSRVNIDSSIEIRPNKDRVGS